MSRDLNRRPKRPKRLPGGPRIGTFKFIDRPEFWYLILFAAGGLSVVLSLIFK